MVLEVAFCDTADIACCLALCPVLTEAVVAGPAVAAPRFDLLVVTTG